MCVCVRVLHLYDVLNLHTCYNGMNKFQVITPVLSVTQFNTLVKNTACFDRLVQANVRNKKLLKDAVQNISAKGITDYTKGFEFAFKQLSAVRKTCYFV